VTDLSGNGVSVTLPGGWEGRVFKRPAAGEVAASAADGPSAPPGEVTNTVVHISTIALPPGVGDFASGAVENLGSSDALIVLFEYGAEAASQALFARSGMPRSLATTDFSPTMLQRALRGQAGVQVFFHEVGRAFCLYVVLGSYQNRAKVVPEVNKVLATIAITDPAVPPVTDDVVDLIDARPDFSTFAALLAESGVAATLRALSSGVVSPVTVFAPVDTAFDPELLATLRADADLLQRTVLQHVVDEQLPVDVLSTRTTLATRAGGTLSVSPTQTGLLVGGATVVPPPAEATNGLVYATGGVFEAPQ